MKHEPSLTPDDPRLLALALGEIHDAELRRSLEAAVAADPELVAAYDDLRAFSGKLSTGLAREPLPFVDPAAVTARAMAAPAGGSPALRRRGAGGLGGSVSDKAAVVSGSSRLRTIAFGAVGLSAAACLAVMVLSQNNPGAAGGKASKVAANVEDSAYGKPGVFSISGPKSDLAATSAALPSLEGAGATFAAAGRAPLALSAPGARGYLAAFSRELEAGRRPEISRIRVDGLVNAFIGARPEAPGSRPVLVESVLTDAPWDATHRLLRVTVRAQGAPGGIVAKNAVAAVDFDPAVVATWRVLGYTGSPKAPEAVALHGGDTVTTLYELTLTGAAGDKVADIAVRYARVDRPAAESVAFALRVSDHRAFAEVDADTRFAAGLAAYAMNLGENPVAKLAAYAGDDAARRKFAAKAL